MVSMFGFGRSRIFLDYASATPVLKEAARAYKVAEKLIGNPSSIHREGVLADEALERARAGVAHELGCKARDIIFTSGLTESNNLAVLGTMHARIDAGALTGTHWITTAIEHPCILECFRAVEKRGGVVTFLSPNAKGIVTAEAIEAALTPHTVFVSIGWANNETGVVQPLARISRTIRQYEKAHTTRITLHSDAGQAPLYKHPAVHTLGVDMLSLGSNKLYGPRGAGALYLSGESTIQAEHHGGGQERGLRSGTENLPAIVGFAEALRIIANTRDAESARTLHIKEVFLKSVEGALPNIVVNGDPAHTLPHMLNISIPGVSAEYLTLALDAKGIAVSAKSACKEGEEKRSHVIAAMTKGVEGDVWRAESALRFSFGRGTTEKELLRAAKVLIELVMTMKEG